QCSESTESQHESSEGDDPGDRADPESRAKRLPPGESEVSKRALLESRRKGHEDQDLRELNHVTDEIDDDPIHAVKGGRESSALEWEHADHEHRVGERLQEGPKPGIHDSPLRMCSCVGCRQSRPDAFVRGWAKEIESPSGSTHAARRMPS